MNCEHQCYCRYGVCIKSTGICPLNRCQRGWKGDTCSEGKLQISILFKIISSGEMTITTISAQRKELSTRPLFPDILIWNVLLLVLIQMQIFILARHVFQWKDMIIQVCRLSTISKYNIREPSLQCIIQKSVWSRFKFGYLNLVCLEKKIYLWT